MSLRSKIKKSVDGPAKQCVIGVGGEPPHLPFCYTIGNHKWRLPELLVVGVIDHTLMNYASRVQRERKHAYEDGEVVLFEGAKFPVKFIKVDQTVKDEYTIQAGVYWRTQEYEVRQMLVPDKNGRFPDDPLCEPPYNAMPVLGVTQ